MWSLGLLACIGVGRAREGPAAAAAAARAHGQSLRPAYPHCAPAHPPLVDQDRRPGAEGLETLFSKDRNLFLSLAYPAGHRETPREREGEEWTKCQGSQTPASDGTWAGLSGDGRAACHGPRSAHDRRTLSPTDPVRDGPESALLPPWESQRPLVRLVPNKNDERWGGDLPSKSPAPQHPLGRPRQATGPE